MRPSASRSALGERGRFATTSREGGREEAATSDMAQSERGRAWAKNQEKEQLE